MLHFELTADEYVAGNLLNARWTPQRWLRVAVVVAALVAFALWKMQDDPLRALTIACGYVALIAFVFLVSRYVYMPWRARRAFVETKALQRRFDWSWDDEQLRYKTDLATGIVPWSNLADWRENESVFALYASTIAFFLIPKRAFPDAAAVDAFRATLAQRIAPSRPETAF